jgi:hypothetical protein
MFRHKESEMSSTPENGGGTKQTIPPYLSHKTFNNFIEGLRTGVPDRIDRSVMPTLSGTAQAHLLYALRYLNLVNGEGKPTETLTQLAAAQGAEKQKVLTDLLKSAYPFVFNDKIDLERCTGKQIEEAFATTGASSETLRKSLAFFLATAKQANLKLSPHMKRTRRPRVAGQRARGAAANARGGAQGGASDQTPNPPAKTEPPASRGSEKTVQLKSGAGSVTLSIDVDLLKLEPGEDEDLILTLRNTIRAYEKSFQAKKEDEDVTRIRFGKDAEF